MDKNEFFLANWGAAEIARKSIRKDIGVLADTSEVLEIWYQNYKEWQHKQNASLVYTSKHK